MEISKNPVKNIFSVMFLHPKETRGISFWNVIIACSCRTAAQLSLNHFCLCLMRPAHAVAPHSHSLLMLRQFPWQPAGCCIPFYLMETEGPAGCRHSVSLTTRYNSSRAQCVCARAHETVEKDPLSAQSDSCRYRPSFSAPFITPAKIKCFLSPSPPSPALLFSLAWYQYVPQSSTRWCAPRSAAH